MFIPIDRETLILKNKGTKVFLMKAKHQFIYPNEQNMLMVPNHEKKEDYYVNPCSSELIDGLQF